MPGEIKILGGDDDGGAFRVPDDIPPDEIPARLTAALQAAFSGGDADESAGALSAADVVPKLVERCERYLRSYGTVDSRQCPFRVGALVTPMEGSPYRGENEPHIVLESRLMELPDFETLTDKGASSNSFGGRRDMRVGYIGKMPGGWGYRMFWVESCDFTDYTP